MVREFHGELTLEVQGGRIAPNRDVSGYLEIAVGSVTSGHRLEDLELRRRINAKEFPRARYELTQLAGGPDAFTVTGDLTWRGVTKSLTADVSVDVEGEGLRVEGSLDMDVRDFDLAPPKVLGLQVHPSIQVVARLHAAEAG